VSLCSAQSGKSQSDQAPPRVGLEQLSGNRRKAQEKYREYVMEGIGDTIWDKLEAQSLLGVEGFAEALREHVTGKETIQEIPKGQRFLGRLSLKKLFEMKKGKTGRDRMIVTTVKDHGIAKWKSHVI
jgi:hypothetical protein